MHPRNTLTVSILLTLAFAVSAVAGEMTLFEGPELSGRRITVRGEIENYELQERILNEYEIDSVFHLAAQPLTRPRDQCPHL